MKDYAEVVSEYHDGILHNHLIGKISEVRAINMLRKLDEWHEVAKERDLT